MALVYNPRELVLVSCRGRATIVGKGHEHHDIVATSWHSPASDEPALYAVWLSASLDFPLSIIRQSGVFCVNLMPYAHRAEAVFCSRHAGEHIDKFSETGLSPGECEAIDCVRIVEAVGYLECELVEERTTGDHVQLIGKVLRATMTEPNAQRLFLKDSASFTTTKD
jgi:flavin reductase (DIM6/NTAB) family NADH-FMN oxidoreductase RutF